MADKTSFDPTAQFREFVQVFEKGFNEMANTTMATDEFSAAGNQAMNAALRVQQMMGTAMGTYFATLNIPSRSDVTALGERLAACEAYLSRIALALEGNPLPTASNGSARRAGRKLAPAPQAKKPPRTKRPPGAGTR